MNYDAIVIGSGPGGYSAACLLAKNGLKTAVVERDKPGGVCLNVGCIPTKAFIHMAEKISTVKKNQIPGLPDITSGPIDMTAVNQKVQSVANQMSKGIDFLFKQNQVDYFAGQASFMDDHTIKVKSQSEEREWTAKYFVIATGSSNKDFFGNFANPQPDSHLIDSTGALALDTIPEKLIVIGGGAIGVEFAYIYQLLGSEVTLLEYLPNLLPGMDAECGKTLERSFKRQKLKVITGAEVTSVTEDKGICTVEYNKNDQSQSIQADYILLAMGRSPNSQDLGIKNLSANILEKGFVEVDQKTMATAIPHIYAIGDIVSHSPMLAHVAYEEARLACEHIVNQDASFSIDPQGIPFCIYSYPQAAAFGLSEEVATEQGLDFKALKLFFKASGKAVALGKSDGFVKILVDNQTETILGASIVGPDATEILPELLVAYQNKIKLMDLVNTMHAHPTLSELIWDTAKSFYHLNLH
ncbi:MAG: dihydrolipoyl dehydrogenase [Spirochaetes bacterium]|nr:dihydrolipoyl dehydrogenase [Spirochaetota bacterium]